MPAYTGLCRIDGDKIIIKVDVAWDESRNGTEQIASTMLKPTSLTCCHAATLRQFRREDDAGNFDLGKGKLALRGYVAFDCSGAAPILPSVPAISRAILARCITHSSTASTAKSRASLG